MQRDVIIIGGGISGLMTAYRLLEQKPHLKVTIIEKGKPLENRQCPIVQGQVKRCIYCKPCAIMEGMAGAGAFSDGKYVISTEYGGWLTDFLSDKMVIDYIEQADKIMVSFGATTDRFMPNDRLKQLCLQHDLHMQQAELKHLGTDSNYDTMLKLIQDLGKRCEIITGTQVTDVDTENYTVTMKNTKKEVSTMTGEYIVFAVGRAGSDFFSGWCTKNKVEQENNQVDVGVRVELPSMVWEHFSKEIYEPKIWYRSKRYGDTTRMFCFNERGLVVTENTNGVLTVNGHAYKDESKKTKNSNFSLLSTIRFTEPFREPIQYARTVAGMANLIAGGGVLVQRLGDLELGRRTNHHRLAQSTTRPTIEAVPGDLSLCMPKRQLDNIIETLHALDKVAPGTANYDTLLYGIECKYYSARPKATDFELNGFKNLFAIGDGAGVTRSLSQAAANGLFVADKILTR